MGTTNKDRTIVLAICEYLKENSDIDHPIGKKELVSALKRDGYSVTAKTLDGLFESINEFNEDIIKRIDDDVEEFFYYGIRGLELTDMQTIIDAVTSARFISEKHTEELIEKIGRIASNYQNEYLVPRIVISDKVKNGSDNLDDAVKTLQYAIDMQKMVQFNYLDYLPDKTKVLKHDGEIYRCSPYACLWNSDAYYVIGYSDKYERIIAFRIDRLINIEIMDEDAEELPEDFDLDDFTQKIFHMYEGHDCKVKLLCNNELMKNIYEHFGDDFESEAYDEKRFVAEVNAPISPAFYSWVFQFSGRIKIISPDEVLKGYRDMLKKAAAK